MNGRFRTWAQRVVWSVALVLGVAVGARVAWWLLAPLFPILVSVAVVATIFGILFRTR